jgi:ribonuclease HII
LLLRCCTRERLLPQLLDLAAATATVIVPPDEIDRVGLHRSNLNALIDALARLQLPGGVAMPDDAARPCWLMGSLSTASVTGR